jgi:hypothetical protein
MGGNVFEWNETLIDGSSRGFRGGSLQSDSSDLQSSAGYSSNPLGEFYDLGFRVANRVEVAPVPEPASLAIWSLVIGTMGVVILRRRRLVRSTRPERPLVVDFL